MCFTNCLKCQEDISHPSNFAFGRRLTCQHIFHDGIPEKRDAVDDVPEALEVGEQVVDSVGRWFQVNLYQCQELSCKKIQETKINNSKPSDTIKTTELNWLVYCWPSTYVWCSFVHSIQCEYSHIHSRFQVPCTRLCSHTAVSSMGYLEWIIYSSLLFI